MLGPGQKNFPFQSKDESSVAGGVAVVGFQPLHVFRPTKNPTELLEWGAFLNFECTVLRLWGHG